MNSLKYGLAIVSALSIASFAPAATIQINAGSGTVANWNTVATPTADVADLLDSTGAATGIYLNTDDTYHFNSANTAGTTSPTAPASDLFPSDVTRSALFGSTALFAGLVNPVTIWTFENMDADTTYTFHFFGSRVPNITDNRDTQYALEGATSASASLNSSNNTSQYVSILNLAPDANGQIKLTVTPGASNTNSTGFYYLNGIVIETTPGVIPEPASLGLLALGGLALIRRRR